VTARSRPRRSSRARAKALAAVAAEIRGSRRVLIASHPSPDGDAIGSTVATLLALRQLGMSVAAFNPDPVPRRYVFLRGAEEIVGQVPEGDFDITLLLDCCDRRLFEACELPRERMGRLVVVDHHLTPCELEVSALLQDPAAAAVGVLLYEVFLALDVTLTEEIVEALFCSIISDTGSFRYQNTNGDAMRVAGELLDRGVDPWRVASRIYEDRPRRELELLTLVLQTLQFSSSGRAATLTVTGEMLERVGCAPDVVDGFINYARGVEGVEVAVLFWPASSDVRVSLRSRGAVDVSKLAEKFGGGGHRNAAGFRVDGDLETVRARLFAEVEHLLDG
jgi:bifunctional oligoribonuclease and PAP phosphatase NrnA